MSVLTGEAPAVPDAQAAPAGLPARRADIAALSSGAAQALFREARRRRRRRQAGIAVAMVLAAVVLIAAVTWLPGMDHETGGRGPSGTAPAARSAATAVWFDGLGRLHVGDIGPGGTVGQRVVAEVNAASMPLAVAGGRVYWVDPAGAFVPGLGHWSQVVRYLDVRTGRIGMAGPGQTVFVSPSGRYLLMSQALSGLTETPVAGGAPRLINVPRGWYLPGSNGAADLVEGEGLAMANGILVQSRESPGFGPRVLALWNPQSGKVQIIGRGRAIIGAYTPPGAPYSLLAWLPAACPPPGSCLIKITNTASLSTRTVRAPPPGFFALGGAFSPGGSQLAVFMTPPSRRSARLAIVDLATGTLRVASRPAITLGEDIGWARWLPDGRHLIVGAGTGGYLVDYATFAARPLILASRSGLRAGSGQAINFTAAIVPPQR